MYRKIDHSHGVGSYENSITFEWLPVGTLENGKVRCSWKDQPRGTEAALFDRYLVKFDPAMKNFYPSWVRHSPDDTLTDGGTKIIVGLERFLPDTTYTWKVAVGRWCVGTLGTGLENFGPYQPLQRITHVQVLALSL